MAQRQTRAVLFACNWNTVRSPMAAALLQRLAGDAMRIESCGLEAGESLDPFAWAVMKEIGIDLTGHRPQRFEALDGVDFDLVVTLSPQVEARAAAAARDLGAGAESWACADPTIEEGSREHRLEAYRRVRDDLDKRVLERFGVAG